MAFALKPVIYGEYHIFVMEGTALAGHNAIYMDAETAIDLLSERKLFTADGGELLRADFKDLPAAKVGDVFCFFANMDEMRYANPEDDPLVRKPTVCRACGRVTL